MSQTQNVQQSIDEMRQARSSMIRELFPQVPFDNLHRPGDFIGIMQIAKEPAKAIFVTSTSFPYYTEIDLQ